MSDMNREKVRNRPSLFAASGFYLLAAIGLWVTLLSGGGMALVISSLWPDITHEWLNLLLNAIYYLPFALLPIALWAVRRNDGGSALRLNPISFGTMLLTVITATLCLLLIQDVITLWMIPLQKLGLNPLTTGLPVAQNAHELVLSVIIVAVIPAACEEFLFRGAIMPAFEGEGSKRAMWITSVLFMLIHGSLMGMPTQIILGMVLALLVFWTDSIYAGLIYHTVHNASAVVLDYIQNQMAATGEATAESADLLTAIGGLSGVVSLLANIAISAALFLITLRLFRARGMLQGVAHEEGKVQKLCRREWIVLAVGAAMCAVLYVSDFIVMLGG